MLCCLSVLQQTLWWPIKHVFQFYSVLLFVENRKRLAVFIGSLSQAVSSYDSEECRQVEHVYALITIIYRSVQYWKCPAAVEMFRFSLLYQYKRIFFRTETGLASTDVTSLIYNTTSSRVSNRSAASSGWILSCLCFISSEQNWMHVKVGQEPNIIFVTSRLRANKSKKNIVQ